MASKKPGKEGGIKGLFTQHVEKMALGVAVVMVFAFLYMGMKHKPLGMDREPAALERSVKNARDNVRDSTWNQAWRIKEWPAADFDRIAVVDAINVEPSEYEVGPLLPGIVEDLKPRVDPHLMAVEKLEVRPGVMAALAVKGGAAGGGGFRAPRRGGGAADPDEDEDSGPPSLNQEQVDAMDQGFRTDDRGSRAVGRTFVVVRGVVPIQNQQDEYDRCFARAMKDERDGEYAAERDTPNYIYAYIERQEVDAQGNPVPFKTSDGEEKIWTRMAMSEKIATAAAEPWPTVEEPADERYTDPNLTMPPPPVLLQDYVSLVMHPDVPLKSGKEKSTGDDKEGADEETDGPGLDLGPGVPDLGGPGKSDDEAARDEDDDDKATERPAKYRLLRYYDFNVDPAKRYRYRVQLLLEDPNKPRDPEKAPDPSTLDLGVIKRIEEAQKGSSRRVFWRESEWSEESAIVDFPPTRRVLAGEVDPGRSLAIGQRAKIQLQEPSATLMALVWDNGEAVWVPGIAKELTLGSVVDFVKNVWVVDPVSFDPRRLSAYPFDTGYTVADIYGGEVLPSDNRKCKLAVPGEVLLIGADGNVNVRSEFDDADTYALFHYTSGGEGAAPVKPRKRGDDDDTPDSFHGNLEDQMLGEPH